jgi:CRP/FNR family cyclic AMP-dependent transcriptional regulator
MDLEKKMWYLNDFNILKVLSEEEKMQMSKMVTDRETLKKEIIHLSEDSADKIYFLKKGKVKISKYSNADKEMILSLIGPGEIFGETGAMGAVSYGTVAEVMEDAIVCSLTINQLNLMLEKNPAFNFSVTKFIGLRYLKVQSRLESLVFKTAPERIRGFIKEMVDEHGKILANGSEIEVKLRLKHEDIAKLTATTRQSVTTELNNLEKEGVILFDRKRILVKDYKGL